jgi:SAM-dependent methyltransferase
MQKLIAWLQRWLTDHPDWSWQRYGQTEPYYAVLTSDRYLQDNMTPAAREEFFASGEGHAQWVLNALRHNFKPEPKLGRVLDFGCGVGRLVIPLARQCDSVVGVDVAEAMLQEARRNCRERDLNNVELVLADDQLSNVSGEFDLIHSSLVFQHIPPRRGEKILCRMLELLKDDGLGALHFTYQRQDTPLRRIGYWARLHLPLVNGLINLRQQRPFRAPLMQMNEYDLNRLLGILQAGGCRRAMIRFGEMPGDGINIYGVTLFFRKRPPSPPT